MNPTIMHGYRLVVVSVAAGAAMSVALSACTPAGHRPAPSPEAQAALEARAAALSALCREVPDPVVTAVVETLRVGEALHVEVHDHDVEIVSWDGAEGIQLDDGWTVSLVVHASDLVSSGHDHRTATWVVDSASVSGQAVWSLDEAAVFFSSAPLGSWRDPGISFGDALDALNHCRQERPMTTIPDPPTAAPAATTTTTVPTTTTRPATTVTTATVPQPQALPDGVAVLSAHSDGIDLLRGGSAVAVLRGVDVSVAWPDYLGGAVFQRVEDQPEWEFDNGLDRWMPIWPDGAETTGIEWIPQVGGPAEMLVSGDGLSTVSPYRADATLIEGAATLVYHRVIGVEHPCDDMMSEDECMWRTAHGFANHVTALDLETGQERPLGITDVYETYSSVSIGGSVAAVTGAEPTEVAMVDVTGLAALGTTGHVLETVSEAWMVYTPERRCDHIPPGTYHSPNVDHGALVSPDGTTLALVEWHPPCSDGERGSAYVVVIDVGWREGVPVLELNTRLLDPNTHLVDYDGQHLLLHAGGQNIVMDRHGTITALPECECRYRFWAGPPNAPRVFADSPDEATAVYAGEIQNG